ncbi:hypothetical protein FUAX_14870 [Fulvitalea axinellae]|uniref:F5/8 type C domain-containing protein n=1 Tax=Fulvitalea axinellae TaxID=1182444 RepID=A0AAU9DDT6_9BACT|nr:hypothetical protein FUAX_14870 [Fulvitalea axinellae]
MTNRIFLTVFLGVFSCLAFAQKNKVFPGADERTPSRSEYFTWINNTNEGPTEAQTMANLEFFKWLREEYGMRLDIYAFDAGAIDGKKFYGEMGSLRFLKQFPEGFGPVSKFATENGTSLGLWGGPDGFGNTPEEAKARHEMMVSLCRDFNFDLFKMDAVCGQLRPEKYEAFDKMMTECRKYEPNLVLLNHRLDLGQGTKHSTTYLLGGKETYIDVHSFNQNTAPHHRAGAISRGLTPNLTRLTEDHGVCLSSCLDYWEDDLVLQAFNRNLVLAPQIYGSPMFLRDDEYPKLARVFNLHRKYRDILVDGIRLPEERYGPYAVARGDKDTRLLTLRNLTWEPVSCKVKLDESIGLMQGEKIRLRQYFPVERILEDKNYGDEIEVEVLPFRVCLLKISNKDDGEIGVKGCDFEVVRNVEGKPVEVKLLAMPGSTKKIKFVGFQNEINVADLDGKPVRISTNRSLRVHFDGRAPKEKYHRKLGVATQTPVPSDASTLYEATCFAADNNALEFRAIKRSGESQIPEVIKARKTFFDQPLIKRRELVDEFMFDDDLETAFSPTMRWRESRNYKRALRIDLGKIQVLDSLVLTTPDEFSMQPLKLDEGNYVYVSKDLEEWKRITFLAGERMVVDLRNADSVRYVKMSPAPMRVLEVKGYRSGKSLDRADWRGSNLFDASFVAQSAWEANVRLDEASEHAYICVAVNGEYGEDGAVVALKIGDRYVGSPDRAPSYAFNDWETTRKGYGGKNNTFYIPVDRSMIGEDISVRILCKKKEVELNPEVWISAYPIPYVSKTLRIGRESLSL